MFTTTHPYLVHATKSPIPKTLITGFVEMNAYIHFTCVCASNDSNLTNSNWFVKTLFWEDLSGQTHSWVRLVSPWKAPSDREWILLSVKILHTPSIWLSYAYQACTFLCSCCILLPTKLSTLKVYISWHDRYAEFSTIHMSFLSSYAQALIKSTLKKKRKEWLTAQ